DSARIRPHPVDVVVLQLHFTATTRSIVDGAVRRRARPDARGRLRLRPVRLGQRPLRRLLATQLQPRILTGLTRRAGGPASDLARGANLTATLTGAGIPEIRAPQPHAESVYQ